ncbi:MAG: hypothetical protein IJR83_06495 [Clostridia bacterium]|nr:hypothetical protein [Clostridia bacterium]
MFVDITGKRRYKMNLHCHTTLSDGHTTPEETMALYAAMGYDYIAITDHWIWGERQEGEFPGPDGRPQKICVIPGCEFDAGGGDAKKGVFHILALDANTRPDLSKDLTRNYEMSQTEKGRLIVDRIHEAGGISVIAHPAWSVNRPEMIEAIGGFDATEIYNSVSDFEMSDRPYSGSIVDMLADDGWYLPLLSTDDSHYCTGEQGRGFIMADADAMDRYGLAEVVRKGLFYGVAATTAHPADGPQVFAELIDENTVRIRTSPVCKISTFSNRTWTSGRIIRGQGLTQMDYELNNYERYVRVEATDEFGRVGYTNFLVTGRD